MPMSERSSKYRFSILQLLVVLTAVGVLLALLLPAITTTREAARLMSCGNNLRQIGLGFHNYHSAYKQLPPACGGTGPTSKDSCSNQCRLSALVAISCFIESSPFWGCVSNPYYPEEWASLPIGPSEAVKRSPYFDAFMAERSGAAGPLVDSSNQRYFPAMGPAPWRAKDYPPWQYGQPTYHCPADQNPSPNGRAAFSNYVLCYGDGIVDVGYVPGEPLSFRGRNASSGNQRGIFANGVNVRFDDVTDGLANTAMVGETVTFNGNRDVRRSVAANIAGIAETPSLCLKVASRGNYSDGIVLRMTPDGVASRGGNWADGAITWTGFNTVLPPNSPSCDRESKHHFDGIFSTASLHRDIAQVLMADGSVKAISNSIDTGAAGRSASNVLPHELPTESPFGVWGAMGTRSGEESIQPQ
ncbi:DUF1559 domain-containing protein [Rhodopirellula sp. MGV]|uniref:DUF1559 domain-containing protein n=1 Tax=Rhodopirellula sp. MGV TaxID=2023130 RepID=UPI000B970053|nr:DUF1559 domain-containing protein [Rhodopirellula sp. MGV]OYP35926.1 hypothetical protein CGZ80_09140 [Rhodopirellula sp. MGV]